MTYQIIKAITFCNEVLLAKFISELERQGVVYTCQTDIKDNTGLVCEYTITIMGA